ncbi:hypothetical protein QBC43DRAFT_106231 [Cladorrhinum sp. PSN259]|nr:hypothetical protein QBC43DRAFT_106231 [Cladorrhinum sp. PSN259]
MGQERYAHGVPQKAYLATIWSFAGVTLIFLSVRLYARVRGPRRIYWDDAFIILTALIILATAILWQMTADNMYYVMAVVAGVRQYDGSDLLGDLARFLRGAAVAMTLYHISLVTIKVSLLLFFRRIGEHQDRLRYVWWPVMVFTLATGVAMLANFQWSCFFGDYERIFLTCGQRDKITYNVVVVKINCALDVISDFMIMMIPVILIWNVRMRLAKKMAFVGLFSLTIITMIIAIVRAAGTTRIWDKGEGYWSYLGLYNAIEACIATIIACLSAFPQLFVGSRKPVYTPSQSRLDRLKGRSEGSSKTPYDISTTRAMGDGRGSEEDFKYISDAGSNVQLTDVSPLSSPARTVSATRIGDAQNWDPDSNPPLRTYNEAGIMTTIHNRVDRDAI